jgi:SAM-dependent methyltransferase
VPEAYDESAYGDAYAEVYDAVQGERDVQDCVEFIQSLIADRAKVFELGIGTGRVAIPLAQRGYRVSGNDISSRMLDQLLAKEDGEKVRVFNEDMSRGLGDEHDYSLVYAAFGTLACVSDLDRQLTTISNVARALAPGGLFMVESNLPDLETFVGGQKVEVGYLGTSQVMISCHEYDPIAQIVRSQHVLCRANRIHMIPIVFRYVWPSELDLMCRSAGLALSERWADFKRTPLRPRAERFVSVYRAQAPESSATPSSG